MTKTEEYKKCSFEGKRCYSQKEANALVNMARKRHWTDKAKYIPKRAYYCRKCGCYHLTKMAAKHDGHKKKKIVIGRRADERRRIERMEEDIHRYTREYR